MKRLFATAFLFLTLQPLSTAAYAATGTREDQPVGVVEMFDFDGNYGTLTRAASGVPRAKPNPALEAMDRWRASAEAFTHGFAVSRGANGTETFRTRRVYEDEIGQAHVRLSQIIAGLPVVGTEIIVHADYQTGKVLGVNGSFAIDRGLARSPKIDAGDAIAATMRQYGLSAALVQEAPELTYIVDEHGALRLAWTNLVSYTSENGLELDRIYGDALTGAAIARHPQVRRAKKREIFDCRDQSTWTNCVFLFGEGGSSPDQKAMAAYNNAGAAWDYFWLRHGHDGVDPDRLDEILLQGINYGGDPHCCGGWTPPGAYTAIVYTDNLGSYSASEAYSLDIVGHEFTHGVIHYSANLTYTGETASIDEGLADIFAVAIGAYPDRTPNWWIAEDIYTKNLLGDALRYVNDPAKKSGYADYYPLRKESTYPDSGICGLAFYLLSQGGSHPQRSSVVVSAQGLDKAEKIFYRAIAAYMTSGTDFRKLEGYTLKAASYLYGFESATYNAVADAWLAVGNHWETFATNPPVGESRWTSAYASTSSGTHTGQLYGSDFDLFLERSLDGGSTWSTFDQATGPAVKKIVKRYTSTPARFRWRIHKARGSGSSILFELGWNHPD